MLEVGYGLLESDYGLALCSGSSVGLLTWLNLPGPVIWGSLASLPPTIHVTLSPKPREHVYPTALLLSLISTVKIAGKFSPP